MENAPGIPPSHGFLSRLVRAWFALTRRKIRVLRAGEIAVDGPAVFAVSHPAGFIHALVLSLAFERPVHCLLPKNLARGPLARFLARHMGMVLYDEESPASDEKWQEVYDVLASGEALVVFADQNAVGQIAPASAAASLLGRAEAQLPDSSIAVYPVHLFLPDSTSQSREILIYIDSAVSRPAGHAPSERGEMTGWERALEARFQENAFQLRPSDLEYFLSDLEEVLRTSLQEEWASRADWKQDTDGFVLSRLAAEWVKQMNYLHPSRLVGLRKSLDDYRALQKQCALRELEVEGGDSPLGTGGWRVLLWFETILGFPIALYGLVNHCVILLVLFLAGTFKRNSSRPASTNWIIRGVVTLVFYILQTFLVAHKWGRAAAGYYAPSLPISGGYLWRYAGLVRPQARLLLISLTIPALKRKIQRLRQALLRDLDHALESIEEKAGVAL